MSVIYFEKKYRERYVRWQDKTIAQLSFFNNLLLTISVGFLSFGYKEIKVNHMTFNLCTYDLKLTLSIVSLIFMAFSIFYGLIVALNRLYDFRITTHINQVRYWTIKHSKINLDESSSTNFKDNLPTLLCLLFKDFDRINIEECKILKNESLENIVEFNYKFKRLRAIANILGAKSWKNLKFQIALFFIGIVLFVFAQICQ